MVLNPTYQSYLCDDVNLDKPVWMTQARKLISKKKRCKYLIAISRWKMITLNQMILKLGIERAVESPCPITGQYMGMITDLSGMCAELSSNCNTREIMYFKVTDCESGELYEGI